MKNNINRVIGLIVLVTMLVQCRSIDLDEVTPTLIMTHQPTELASVSPDNTPSTSLIETSSFSSQMGCVLPPLQVSNQVVHNFYWSEDSESIIYREEGMQIFYDYDTILRQAGSEVATPYLTSTAEYEEFNVEDYVDAYVSHSHELMLFTRGTLEKYSVYYKRINETEEHYLGTIQGQIKKIDWFDDETKALIAIDWQAPGGVNEAPIYIADFSTNQIKIEMPKMNTFYNIEYLGLTPDETRFLFVSYANKDRTVKMWNLLTKEIVSTSVFIPLSYKWVSEDKFISVGYQNPDLYPLASVLLYDIESSNITFLVDAKFSIDSNILNSVQIAPDGLSVAFIENETGILYWTVCKY